MDTEEINGITQTIIGCAIKVSRTLGPGFLEKVYENALVFELRRSRLYVEQQKALDVFYEGIIVGQYFADLVVEETVLVELKAAKAIDETHQAQVLNYLKTTRLPLGLILNFGTAKLGIKRLIF
jgi:GxxExxY protein